MYAGQVLHVLSSLLLPAGIAVTGHRLCKHCAALDCKLYFWSLSMLAMQDPSACLQLDVVGTLC